MKLLKVVLFDTYIPEKDSLYYSFSEEDFHKVSIGKAVIVPLKRAKKLGYIWDILDSDNLEFEVFPVFRILDNVPPLSEALIRLVNWVSEYYANSFYRTANYVFPAGVELDVIRYLKARDVAIEMSKKQEKVFLSLIEKEKEDSELKRELGVSESVIKALLKKGAIEERFEIVLREKKPRKPTFLSEKKGHSWGDFKVDRKIFSLLDKPLLLFVESRIERWKLYFEIAKFYYEKGKSVLFVFPTVKSLLQFGDFISELVPFSIYFYHSFLTEAQSYQVFKTVTSQQTIVLSTSKGLFLPFKELGVIIVDQEESEFYNMREKEPKYDSIAVAVKRSELENVPLVLGTSSPSIRSFHKAIYNKSFTLYRKPLLRRPKVTIVDLRKDKTGELLDFYTIKRIRENLIKSKKVFILLNRLGYSTYLQCQDCGYIFICPHCKAPLVFHKDEKKMKCHYCNYVVDPPQRCNICEGYSFIHGGVGTERLTSYLNTIFNRSAIQRVDSEIEIQDEKIIYESDIIVGTRLIEPWLDGKDIGVLIIYNLDNFLHIPDFSSSEKTFNMVRRILGFFNGEEIIIRTYSPYHYIIRALKSNSYGDFLYEELKYRQSLKYPPFSKLHQIILEDLDENEILEEGNVLVERLKETFRDTEVLGPAPYYPFYIKERYRYQIIIKDRKEEVDSRILRELCEKSRFPLSNLKFIINIDINEIIT